MTGKKMNILAIGSHPDDIEFGCGGTLHKLANNGHRIYLQILTRGNAGGDTKVRHKEQMTAAASLKATEVFWGNYTDTKLPFYDNVIEEIDSVVKKTKPSFVFVHHGKDTHQDHRYVSECAVVATRKVPNVLFFEGPTTINFTPTVFVDIGKYISQKFKSLACHKSQVMRTNIAGQSILDIARATAVFRGTQCRVPHAEGFASLRLFVLSE